MSVFTEKYYLSIEEQLLTCLEIYKNVCNINYTIVAVPFKESEDFMVSIGFEGENAWDENVFIKSVEDVNRFVREILDEVESDLSTTLHEKFQPLIDSTADKVIEERLSTNE
jgi:hypothetical protein